MGLIVTLFLSAFATLAIVHVVATKFFLYWKYQWLDIPMHFLGGIVCTLGIAILPFLHIRFFERHHTLVVYVSMVCIIGVGWEMFEYSVGLYQFEPDIVIDTFIDLCMDILGAIVGYSIVKRIKQLYA